MAKVTPINQHFQYFLGEMKKAFWGDLYGQTRQAWQRFSRWSRTAAGPIYGLGGGMSEGRENGASSATGYYDRDFVTRFGTIRLRIGRRRGSVVSCPPGCRFPRQGGHHPPTCRVEIPRRKASRISSETCSARPLLKTGECADGIEINRRSARSGAARVSNESAVSRTVFVPWVGI